MPYVSDKRIEEQLKSLLYDFKKEKKFQKQELMLNVSYFYLFDICTCKCKVSEIETYDRSEKISCNCYREIPVKV